MDSGLGRFFLKTGLSSSDWLSGGFVVTSGLRRLNVPDVHCICRVRDFICRGRAYTDSATSKSKESMLDGMNPLRCLARE